MISIPWKFVGIGVVAVTGVLLFSYITVLQLKLDNLSTENKYLAQSLKDCHSNNNNLAGKLKDLGDEVDKFRLFADKRLKEREKDLEKAKREADKSRDRASDLISRLPTPGENACTSADKLINEEILKNETR